MTLNAFEYERWYSYGHLLIPACGASIYEPTHHSLLLRRAGLAADQHVELTVWREREPAPARLCIELVDRRLMIGVADRLADLAYESDIEEYAAAVVVVQRLAKQLAVARAKHRYS